MLCFVPGERGAVFFCKSENRKGAAKPRPLCTPLGLFLSSASVEKCVRLLTCACMLLYWLCQVEPMCGWRDGKAGRWPCSLEMDFVLRE